jgi:hypothetical protein
MLHRQRDWRQPAARIAAFLILLGVAGWPWSIVRRAFSSAYCATVGAALPLFGFGEGGVGHARVLASPPTDVRRPGENVTSDAEVELSLEGSTQQSRLGVNLRRDAYLPLLILFSAVVVAPLRPRSKGICLLAGVPIVLAASLAALAILVGWVFAGGLGPPSGLTSPTLDLMVRMLLEPPGNRFIGPLVLAALLIAWRVKRERESVPARDV